MDNDQTLEVPLPEGTRPDPDTVVTQEIPRVAETLVMPRETFLVSTLPTHLLGDPILTMDAPRPDETPLYDQLNPRSHRAPKRPRRRMRMADKVLVGMSAAAIAGITVIYGMVAYGWGAGPEPVEAQPRPSRTVVLSAPTEPPAVYPTSRHIQRPRPQQPVVAVVAPTRFTPLPVRSVTPTPTPTRTTEAPGAPETSSSAPEPTQTSASPSEAPSATPTASQSTTPASPSISLEPR